MSGVCYCCKGEIYLVWDTSCHVLFGAVEPKIIGMGSRLGMQEVMAITVIHPTLVNDATCVRESSDGAGLRQIWYAADLGAHTAADV